MAKTTKTGKTVNSPTVTDEMVERLQTKLMDAFGVPKDRQAQLIEESKQDDAIVKSKMQDGASYLPTAEKEPRIMLLPPSPMYRFVPFTLHDKGQEGSVVNMCRRSFRTFGQALDVLQQRLRELPDKSVRYADINLVEV